jgi:hypothetical protein
VSRLLLIFGVVLAVCACNPLCAHAKDPLYGPRPPSNGWLIAAGSVAGASLVSIGAGLGFGVSADNSKSEIRRFQIQNEDGANNGLVDAQREEASRSRSISRGLFIGGGVGLAASAGLLAVHYATLAPKDPNFKEPEIYEVNLRLTFDGVVLEGTW